MVSLNDVRNWLGNRASDVQNDFNRAKDTTQDAMVNGNVNANLTRRDYLKGVAGAAAVGAGGEMGAYSGTANAAGDAAGTAGAKAGQAWDAIGEAIPYEIRSPITRKDGQGNTTTPTDNSTTPSGNNTETGTENETETETGTETDTEEPDFAYGGISEGLLDQPERAEQAFMGYSVTALDTQLDGVGYEEVIENTSDYEAQVMEVLEGTDFEDGQFRLGEYGVSDERPDGRWLDMDEIGVDDDDGDLISYMDELHDEGQLEEEMFGYFEDLERSDL